MTRSKCADEFIEFRLEPIVGRAIGEQRDLDAIRFVRDRFQFHWLELKSGERAAVETRQLELRKFLEFDE